MPRLCSLSCDAVKRIALFKNLKQRAQQLKAETYALYLAARDPRTPWYAKLLVAGIVAYALSPIDLIPDFIPVIGYLDDLILLPLGILWAIKLIPPAVLAECRAHAQTDLAQRKPVSWVAATVIIGIWIGLSALGLLWLHRTFQV